MAQFLKGDRVKHLTKGIEGLVTSTPKAMAAAVAVRMDGKISTQYYRMEDLQVIRNTAVAQAPIEDLTKTNGTNGHAGTEAVEVTVQPVRNARTEVDQNYGGEITLERLYQLRETVAGKLRSIDDRILLMQIQVVVKKALDPVRNMADVESRTALAGDLLKVRKELDEMLGKL